MNIFSKLSIRKSTNNDNTKIFSKYLRNSKNKFHKLKSLKKSSSETRGFKRTLLLVILITLIFFITSLLVGASKISILDTLKWFFGYNYNVKINNIILYVRLPRAIACLLCGSSLATSGLLLQATLNNPLASPGTIGVNSGAALFVVIASVLFPSYFFARTFSAFIGAILTTLCVYSIARKTGASRMTIIMSGVAVTSLSTAFIDMIVTLRPNALMDKSSFFIGGFTNITSEQIIFTIPYILLGLLGAFILAPKINIMILGDDVSESLGIHVERVRFYVIICASALAASAVSISGLLGFVGLIVPYIVRLFFSNNYKQLIPLTLVCGGALVLICDTLARIIFIPYEIPVGIILSCLGSPFFLYLLLNRRKGVYND
jgi:iron complex transport system permease protein